MWGGIMLEFGSREEVWPTSGIIGIEYLKIGFDFLVGSFCLSVGLWVVGSGESDIIFEEWSKFPC